MKAIDLTGQTIRGVKIVERVKGNHKGTRWLCICPFCGRAFIAAGYNLRANNITSCGCRRVSRKAAPQFFVEELGKVERKHKYGCPYCATPCGGSGPCKYANILDEYKTYDEYDKEVEALLGGVAFRRL